MLQMHIAACDAIDFDKDQHVCVISPVIVARVNASTLHLWISMINEQAHSDRMATWHSYCSATAEIAYNTADQVLLTCRAGAFANRRLQSGKGQSGSCLHARSAAAALPCSTAQAASEHSCPVGSVCMTPVVSPGEHMFKLCFTPSSTSGDERWLPGQASANLRSLLSIDGAKLGHSQEGDAAEVAEQQHEVQHAPTVNHTPLFNTITAQEALHANAAHQLPESAASQRLPASAYMAAHPVKDAIEVAAAKSMYQGRSVNTSGLMQEGNAEPDAISNRIGRVALANEHRKVAMHGTQQPKEMACAHYLVYVGTSGQLMQAMEVSDFAPKSSFIPLQWPHILEQILVYTFAVSAALALINMAPIWYLDGEAALTSAIKLRNHSDVFYSSATQPSRHWGRLLRCVLGVGSCIFVCVLLLHMVRLFGYDAKLGQHLHTLGKLLSFVMT